MVSLAELASGFWKCSEIAFLSLCDWIVVECCICFSSLILSIGDVSPVAQAENAVLKLKGFLKIVCNIVGTSRTVH